MRRVLGCAVVAAALVLVGCSNGDAGSDSAGETTSSAVEEAAPATLRILVSNDDGIDHPGLDLVMQRLSELPEVEITVVAPAENRSGSGDQTTPGGAEYTEGETASGMVGTAVDGFPADSIAVALDELGLEPHVVVSGINDAHNIGPFAELSGTLGVVRTAVSRGVPGVAGSAGLEFDEGEFGVAADLIVEWITEHRDELVEGTLEMDEAISFNVPTCDPEDMGEVVEVPIAEEFPDGVNPFESSCDLAIPEPEDDYEAVSSGYPSMSMVPVDF